MTQPEMVRASLLADESREHHHDVYRHRGSMAHGPVVEEQAISAEPFRESMRPAGVRKMGSTSRVSRKSRHNGRWE